MRAAQLSRLLWVVAKSRLTIVSITFQATEVSLIRRYLAASLQPYSFILDRAKRPSGSQGTLQTNLLIEICRLYVVGKGEVYANQDDLWVLLTYAFFVWHLDNLWCTKKILINHVFWKVKAGITELHVHSGIITEQVALSQPDTDLSTMGALSTQSHRFSGTSGAISPISKCVVLPSKGNPRIH